MLTRHAAVDGMQGIVMSTERRNLAFVIPAQAGIQNKKDYKVAVAPGHPGRSKCPATVALRLIARQPKTRPEDSNSSAV
jgi:hypothetical protein